MHHSYHMFNRTSKLGHASAMEGRGVEESGLKHVRVSGSRSRARENQGVSESCGWTLLIHNSAK